MEAAQQPHHLMKRVIDSKTPQECVRTVASPKPNQVGTVLLYGIPIVSLYIESQERLCLAQISNTLLKQFSYNEIHNRRVALGITCVQCTPVQLEILRRAGAMPVSSRRCGMITRREAERLCKSFLGDNAPPRLPDDFAFSVHHECAWGCRGSFLPSRYNSSRAKCIKCSYCGLFFSPNKFIFHSHRIGPGDKYVQPDAANFNSWRRHMKLSGNPPEEIIHAWEDVKAMFNGGTRKRLMSNSPSSSHSVTSPKRMKETQISPPLIHAAAAAAVATAAATANVSQFPIRPVNIHHPTSPTTTNSAPRIPGLGSDLPLPFSRSFMMDYMWHAQNKSNALQFPGYTLPWMKRPASLLFAQPPTTDSNTSAGTEDSTTITNSNYSNIPNAAGTNSNSPLHGTSEIESKSVSFYNNSAFKPVIHQGRTTFSSAAALAIGALIDDEQRTSSRNSRDDAATIKESLSSDDEMVDIETTEEEHPDSEIKFKNDADTGISINVSESPPIEVDNSNDMGWEGIMKKENTSKSLGNIRRSTTPLQSHSSSSSVTSEHQSSVPVLQAPICVDVTTATTTVAIARSNNLSVEQLTVTPSAAAAAAVAIAAISPPALAAMPPQTTRTVLNNNNNTSIASNNNNNIFGSSHTGNELWSVARLSFDRPDYRIPFYRHDITKHFQTFRHGETTTQTNGIG